EADIGVAVPAIDCEGEDGSLANVLELADDFLVLRIIDGEGRLTAEEEEPSIQAHQGVVRRRAYFDALDDIPIGRIGDDHAAIFTQVPVTGRHIDLLTVRSNRGPVRAGFKNLIPDHLFR